jgi:regulator of cell morphogenesis and NO signaling
MNINKFDPVAVIVTNNHNAASVFNFYGIDFYSQGNTTLEDACIENNVAMNSIIEDLCDLRDQSGNVPDFANMNMIALSTYILRIHHKFTEKKLVFIRNTMHRLIGHYGEDHSNLAMVRKTFEELSIYLTVHMKHEEFIVFPYIQKMVRSRRMNLSTFQTIERPISSMRDDHDYEVAALKKLAELTDNFAIPSNADYTLKITYNAMKDLVEDLKIHMHLENNILFPKAIEFVSNRNKNLN